MTNEPYSNREIDAMQKEIHEKLDLILMQTTKTNGRVNSLEEWRSYVVGAVAVLVMIGVPLMSYNIWQTLELNKTVAGLKK